MKKRMPGHDGPGNEMPLAQKAALAWVKRWVKQQAKGDRKMDRMLLGRLLKFSGAILIAAGTAVIANDWSGFLDFFAQNAEEAKWIAGGLVTVIAGFFVRKKILGKIAAKKEDQ